MSSLQATCHILRVPGELIFKFLEYLLPLISDTADLREPPYLGDLSDLIQCRLVCHTFYDISSSLVWRRARFILPGYRSSTQSTVSAARADVSRLATVVNFLTTRPSFVMHIRLLIMVAQGPLFEQTMHRSSVAALSTVVPLFTGLRVLCLDNVSIIGNQIMLQLLLCPVLHTLRLSNIDFSSLSVGRPVVNRSIKCLGIHRCKKSEKLFKLMPSVRAFDGEMDEAAARMSRWTSLNEISFRSDVPAWNGLAQIFMAKKKYSRTQQTWRLIRRNISPSVTELMISQWHFNPKIRDLGSVIRPFAGNLLTKLILYYVEEPSIQNLELIIHLFPGLRQLSLLSDEELAQWPSSVESYGRCLSRLTYLQLLEWNFYDGDIDQNFYGDWNMISEDRLSEIVLSLADQCRDLHEVRFCLVIDGYMGLTVFKDGAGHTEIENIFYCDSSIFCTSSWHHSRFRDI